jgi:short-subunit dehydrogenase
MDAEPVVRKGLAALDANDAVVITGALNRVVAFSTRLAPRAIARKVAGTLNL